MQKLSVVIVCKNEAGIIGRSLAGLAGLSDDIIVYDNGSTDGTLEIIKHSGAKLFEGSWEGFGKTKNKANALAKYDWILSLDADETADEELKKSLLQLELLDEKKIYEFRFKNFLGKKWLRFGEWGGDKHVRLFNRRQVKWNDAEVHEELVLPAGTEKKSLNGFVLHRTAADIDAFRQKMKAYAELNAEKYFHRNKKAGWLKPWLSPLFSFLKNYFFKAGFLDGAAGFHCARISAWYTFLKYKKLRGWWKQV
jgi:glycosyltransferase involved in cell wall biosynthesis